MSDLVKRLSTGEHPVEVSLRPEATMKAFREAIGRGYVHVKFTGTRGGTELGVPIDLARSAIPEPVLDQGRGECVLVGPLSLDFVKVLCHATIDVATLKGTGHLEPVAEEQATA